jgi:hypothetical protein
MSQARARIHDAGGGYETLSAYVRARTLGAGGQRRLEG